MRDVWKARLAIVLMSISFFLMLDLNHVNCVGDYILEFFNISSWTGDNAGTHLTVLYFGVVFLLSILMVKTYAFNRMKFTKQTVLISFIALVSVFVVSTNLSVKIIKANSKGLLAIGYHNDLSVLQYDYQNDDLTDFVAVFTLENYNDEYKEFYVSIDSPWYRKEDTDKVQILDCNENKAIFELYPMEKRTFILSLKDYRIEGGRDFVNGGTSASISEMVLSNDRGESILLSNENFFGIVISK